MFADEDRQMAAKLKRDEIRAVRDRIAAIPAAQFDMASYFGVRTRGDGGVEFIDELRSGTTNRNAAEGSCRSCACIAGHALAILAPDQLIPDSPLDEARKLLGLRQDQAELLFEPHNHDDWFFSNHSIFNVTQVEAVAVLDHLLNTGKVDWSVARKAEA